MPYNYFSSSHSLFKGEKFRNRMEKNCYFVYAPKSSGNLWWPQVLQCWSSFPYNSVGLLPYASAHPSRMEVLRIGRSAVCDP